MSSRASNKKNLVWRVRWISGRRNQVPTRLGTEPRSRMQESTEYQGGLAAAHRSDCLPLHLLTQ